MANPAWPHKGSRRRRPFARLLGAATVTAAVTMVVLLQRFGAQAGSTISCTLTGTTLTTCPCTPTTSTMYGNVTAVMHRSCCLPSNSLTLKGITAIAPSVFAPCTAITGFLYASPMPACSSHLMHAHPYRTLSSNALTVLPENSFSGLSAVGTLQLNYNQIASIDVQAFAGLFELVDLDLTGNQLTTLAAYTFAPLSKLNLLRLASNRLSGIVLHAFFGLSKLTTLYLEDNLITNIAGFALQDVSATLHTLFLQNNRISAITEETFAGLSGVNYLYLLNNQLTTIPDGAFAFMGKLIELSLTINQISSWGTSAFQGLEFLQMLDLSRNSISTIPSGAFSGLPELVQLDLSKNRISTVQSNAFANVFKLLQLDLSSNSITNLLPTSLAGIPAMHTLLLQSNGLQDLPPTVFSGMPLLTALTLSDNDLADLDSRLFSSTTKLSSLYVRLPAPASLTRLAHRDLTANPKLITLPRDIFDAVAHPFVLSDVDSAECFVAGGLFITQGTGGGYCAKQTAVATLSPSGCFEWTCEAYHDRLALPPQQPSTVCLGAAPHCSYVTIVDFSHANVVSIDLEFVRPLLRLLLLNLSANLLTLMPAGFGDLMLQTHPGATVRLANNLFSPTCLMQGSLSKFALGSNDPFCEAYVSVSARMTRYPSYDAVALAWTDSTSQFVQASFSYQLGALPAVSGNTTTSTQVIFYHSAMPQEVDGQLSSITFYPQFNIGSALPITFRWVLSIAPPSAVFVSRPPARSSSSTVQTTFRCSKFSCSFAMTLNGESLPGVRQTSATGLAFDGATLDALALPAVWSTILNMTVVSPRFQYQLDGMQPTVVNSFKVSPNALAVGRHELLLWALDASDIRQPCPLGIWWQYFPFVPVIRVDNVLFSWVTLAPSTDNVMAWSGCTAASQNCDLRSLPFPAVPVTPGVQYIESVAVDVLGRPTARLQQRISILPAVSTLWDAATGSIQVLAQSPFSLQSRTNFQGPWEPAPLQSVAPAGTSVIQFRWTDGTGGTGAIVTAGTLVDMFCVASIQVLPRLPACAAPGPATYCLDEPVAVLLKSNCTGGLEYSVNTGTAWMTIVPGFLSLEPPATSMIVRRGARVLASAVWQRAESFAFQLQLVLTCKPPSTSTETFARLCVAVNGWLPPSATLQAQYDTTVWQPITGATVFMSNLAPGQHSASVRAVILQTGRVLASVSQQWTVADDTRIPWLAWIALPPPVSWAPYDTLAWASPEVPVAHYQVRPFGKGGWDNTTITSTTVAGSPDTFVRQCVSLRGVTAAGRVSPTLTHCWWTNQLWLSLDVATSNGGSGHGVFDVSKSLLMLWKPAIPESGVQAMRFLISDQCTIPITAHWTAAPAMLINATGLAVGWHTIIAQGIGMGPTYGPTQCRRVFVATNSVPLPVLTQAPAAVSTESITHVSFTNSTPVLANVYWFECRLGKVDPTCPGGAVTDPWRRCLSPLPLGPLVPGGYTLNLRTNGPSVTPSAVASYAWTVQPSTTSTITLQHLTDGPHTLIVTPSDDTGKTGPAISTTWFVDTAAPVVTSTAIVPAPSCIGTLCFSSAPSLNIAWAASDLPRISPCSDCSVLLQVTTCPSVVGTACTARTLNGSSLSLVPEGTYSVQLRPVDPTGNLGIAVPLQFIADRTAPNTSVTFVSPSVTNLRNLTVRITSEEWSMASFTIGWRSVWASSLPSATGVHTATASLLGFRDGQHTLVATSTDAAGNVDSIGVTRIFTLDRGAPSTYVRQIAPSLSHGVTNALTASLLVWGKDITTAISYLKVAYTPPQGSTTVTTVSNDTIWTVDRLGTGTHSVQVQAADQANNLDTKGVTVTWTVDLTPPSTTATLVGPVYRNYTVAGLKFTFADDIGGAKWQVSHSGPMATFSSLASFPTESVTKMQEGQHTFVVRAVDWAGNVDPVGASLSVVVDLSPPSSTTVALRVAAISNGTAVVVALGGTDAVSPISGWRLAHTGPSATYPTFSATSQVLLSDLAEGQHQLSAYAIDMANWQDPHGASVSWIIDRTAPQSAVSLAGSSPTNSTAMQLRLGGHDTTTLLVAWSIAYEGPGCAVPQWSTQPQIAATSCVIGVHKVTVFAYDQAGNRDPNGVAVQWTVDRSPPSTAATLISPAVTNVTSATFSFGGLDTVTYIQEWHIRHTLPSGGSRMFVGSEASYQLGQLDDGLHCVHVQAQDAAGNLDPIGADLCWRVDTTAPTTTVALGQQSLVTSANVLRMQFGGTDAGGSGITRWYIWVDGMLVGPSSQAQLDSAALPDGIHTITVRAQDLAGNRDAAGAQLVVTVDTTAPSTTVQLSSPSPTPLASMTLHLGGHDASTSVQHWLLRYSAPNRSREDLIVSNATAVFLHTQEGLYNVTAFAMDAVGNTDTIGKFVRWTVDLTAPVTSAWLLTPNVTNSAAVSIGLGGTDTVTAVVNWQVTYQRFNNGAQVAIADTLNRLVLLTNLQDGAYSSLIKAVDAVQHVDTRGVALTWVVDTHAPTSSAALQFTSPTSLQDGVVWLVGTDATTRIERWMLQHVTPASQIVSVVSAVGNRAIVQLSNMTEGLHTLRASAVDSAGNVQLNFTSISWIVDRTPPESAVGLLQSSPSAATTMRLQLGGTDSITRIVRWQLSHSGPVAVFQAISEVSEVVFTQLGEGQHVVTVRAVDEAGNVEIQGSVVRWTTDLTAPDSRIRLVGRNPTNLTAVTVQLQGNDSTTAVDSWRLQHAGPSASMPVMVVAETNGMALFSAASLAEGQHTITAFAVDVVGHTETNGSALRFVVDVTPPTSTISLVGAAAVVSVPTVSILLNGQDVITAVAQWSLRHAGPFAQLPSVVWADAASNGMVTVHSMLEGRHSVTAMAADAAGNVQRQPASVSWTVDRTAPSSTVTCIQGSQITNATTVHCELGGADTVTSVAGWYLHHAGGVATLPSFVTTRMFSVSNMAEGTHRITVFAVDEASNQDSTGASWQWIVDTVPPSTTATLVGTSPTRNATVLVRAVGFDAISGVGAYVVRHAGPGAMFAPLSQNGLIAFSGLADGGHQATVCAADQAGNEDRQCAVVSWAVDTLAPSTVVHLLSAAISRDTMAQFLLGGSDVTTSVAGWQVAHLQPSGSLQNSTTWSPALRITASMEGSHVLQVRAFDAVDNTDAVGQSVQWTVDTSAPTTEALLVSGAVSSSRAARLTLGGRDAITAIVGWNLAHRGPAASVVASTSDSLVDVTDCDEGTHEVTAASVDAAGNVDSVGRTVRWVNDYSPPATTLVRTGPALTNSSTVVLTAGGSDALTTVTQWLVRHTRPTAGTRIWTANANLLVLSDCEDGLHAVRVQAADAAGNTDPIGISLSFQVDTVPPTTRFTVYPQELMNVTTVAVVVEASEPNCKIWLQLDKAPPRLIQHGVRVQLAFLSDGQHEIMVTSTDAADNAQLQPLIGTPFVVDTTPINDASVQFDDLDAVGTALLTSKSVVRIRFLQADADNRPCWQCRLSLRPSGVLVVRVAEGVGPQGVLSVTLSGEGHALLQPTATDAAGNTAVLPSLRVTRDVQAPQAHMVAASVANGGVSNQTTVTLTLSSTEPAQSVYRVSSTFLSTTAVAQGNPARITLTGFGEGMQCVAIQAEDFAHNVQAVPLSWCWTVDTVPPTSVWVQPPGALVASRVVAGTIVAPEPGVIVALRARDEVGVMLQSTCTGTRCSLAVTRDGHWTVWLQAVDAAGNLERLPQSRVVTVDSQAPELSWAAAMTDGTATRQTVWTAVVSVSDLSAVTINAVTTCLQSGEALIATVSGLRVSAAGLSDGNWTITVTATDEAGHVSAPLKLKWTVDTRAPKLMATQLPVPKLNVSASVPLYTAQPICMTVQCADELTGCSVGYTVTLLTRYASASCGASQAGGGSAGVLQRASAAGVVCASDLVDGLYKLDLTVVDGVGNSFTYTKAWSFGLDTIGPAAPQVKVSGIEKFQTKDKELHATVVLAGDPSPEQQLLRLRYRLDSGNVTSMTGVTQATTDSGVQHSAPLSLLRIADGLHLLKVWAVDAVGNVGVDFSYQWTVQSAPPNTVIDRRPDPVKPIGLTVWEFHIRGVVANASSSAAVATMQVKLDNQEWRDVCGAAIGSRVCKVPVAVTSVGPHTLSARVTNELGVTDPEPELVQWTVKQCSDTQVSTVDPVTGVIQCDPCPTGGNCLGGKASLSQVVARQGYWANAQSSVFYDCPLEHACIGGNGSVRAACAAGYTGVLCSLCADAYYLQFGQCLECPADTTSAWFYMIGALMVVLVLLGTGMAVREYLPQTVMKIGLAMVQIIGNANTAFSAPWPEAFVSMLTAMKVFMLELLALTRTSCAAPVTFYTSFNVTVFGMTAISGLIAAGVFVRHRSSPKKIMSKLTIGQLLKPLFMFWLLCYPAVSLKLFQLFKCLEVEGTSLLRADMRLVCYDGTWWGYAFISVSYLLVFTAGIPAGIAVYLFQRRHKLDQAAVAAEAGFLYLQYGSQAYAWETVELVRKLVLTCVLTLLDSSSPLPLTLAVLVSAFAQVAHAAFKPFVNRKYYFLQHGSLTCTLLVFVIGLMFKVKQTGLGATVLTTLLVGMCSLMLMAIVAMAAVDVLLVIRQKRETKFVPDKVELTPTAAAEPQPLMNNPLYQVGRSANRKGAFKPLGGGK